jgi:hypothetical protein
MAMVTFGMSRKRDRSLRADALDMLLTGIKAEKIVPAPAGLDVDSPDGKFAIARVHGLRLNTTELYSSTAEALWEDGSSTFIFVGDMLETEGERRMLKRCPSSPLTLIVSRLCVEEQKELSTPPEVLELLDSLVDSGCSLLSKSIRNRMGSNPRTLGARQVGKLIVPAIPMPELLWKAAVHKRAPARTHVWVSGSGAHRTAIPVFETGKGPSRLVVSFETVVSMLDVLPLDGFTGAHPRPDDFVDTMAAVPKCYVETAVSTQEIHLMSGLDAYDPAVRFDELENWCEGLQAGEWGVAVAKR